MKQYDIAAYIWPAYTGNEERAKIFWPDGIGEWQTVKNAVSKFEGHSWPRTPQWGYVNEADPYIMEMEINAAVEHGVNTFIYDWYWYDHRPFLENCLNDGFLKAKSCNKMRFYLMWANHSANYTWDIRLSHNFETVVWDGAVSRKEFESIAERLIHNYFVLPNYYKIDGKPVFMFYDLANLIRGLGGVEQTKEALAWFREESVKAGLNGLHLQLVMYGMNGLNLSGVDSSEKESIQNACSILGFDSLTHYQFVHFTDIDKDYEHILHDVEKYWHSIEKECLVPYFPHISVGWDNNPRFRGFRSGIVRNNSPEAFKKGLQMARDYIDRHPELPPLITINSWNEWTESSYLQPDSLYGYGYLNAVKDVFVTK